MDWKDITKDKLGSMPLAELVRLYRELGIDAQIDYDKFYLYSIITHSTAIEGSTVTELENQLLFDEGITAKGRSLQEQMMNLDLKDAYECGREQIMAHPQITVDFLRTLSAKVMARCSFIRRAMCSYSLPRHSVSGFCPSMAIAP